MISSPPFGYRVGRRDVVECGDRYQGEGIPEGGRRGTGLPHLRGITAPFALRTSCRPWNVAWMTRRTSGSRRWGTRW